MREIILITREELEEIIDNCFARHLPKIMEPPKQPEQKLLYSLRELVDFLGCSVVTVHNLKKSGKIRYKQFGRKGSKAYRRYGWQSSEALRLTC